ncbi:flotillin family protein [Myxococcota bacterium]|nr:flotillin family protein [Myxococcota bacterium]MBU1534970.1 flotillin family protein [Myxococcota bacterium]
MPYEVYLKPFLYGVGAGLGLYIILRIVINMFFYIGKPNQVLIFSGRNHKFPDGTTRGYRYVIGGWAFRMPLFEQVATMDLTEMPVNLVTRGAYSKGGISIDVSAIANVKIPSTTNVLDAAIEHFLGQQKQQIMHVAQETLEGHLRGVIATMTPEDINEDRLEFAKRVSEEVEPDFEKLGLHLDNLKIQSISDSEDYLVAIGKKLIEEIKKKAAVAESDADKYAKNREEEAKGHAKAVNEEVEMVVRQAQNELDTFYNDELAKVTSEEQRTIVAAAQARALAEQELQRIRSILEEKRRQVNEILPAQVQRTASEILAKGEAIYLQKRGEATAIVLGEIHNVWKEAGDIAKDVYILQQIESILGQVVNSVKDLKMDNITLLDGGDGDTLRKHVQSYPAMISAVLNELKNITGIDITEVLSPNRPGTGSPSPLGMRPSGLTR